MYRYEDIRKIHLEITQKCNASCPMCDRNENGGAVNKHIRDNLAELSLQDCQDIFEPQFIKQLDMMYMCGNLGDPISALESLEVFDYFRSNNDKIWLQMNTNAGARSAEWWRDLAKTIGRMGTVIFSVDGLEETNHLYRQGVHWDIVERNMRAFIDAGGRARWDYLIFEHSEKDVERAERLAAEWGFEKFTKKKTGRFITTKSEAKEKHQAVNRKGTTTTTLAKPKKAEYQNRALVAQKQIEKKHGDMRSYYDKAHIQCKVAPEGNVFVTAEGLVLPCCWTAGRMYKWWFDDPRQEQIWDFIDGVGGKDSINAKLFGFRGAFESGIMKNIQDSWGKHSIADGKLAVCSMKCGTEFDPFAAQFE